MKETSWLGGRVALLFNKRGSLSRWPHRQLPSCLLSLSQCTYHRWRCHSSALRMTPLTVGGNKRCKKIDEKVSTTKAAHLINDFLFFLIHDVLVNLKPQKVDSNIQLTISAKAKFSHAQQHHKLAECQLVCWLQVWTLPPRWLRLAGRPYLGTLSHIVSMMEAAVLSFPIPLNLMTSFSHLQSAERPLNPCVPSSVCLVNLQLKDHCSVVNVTWL